MSASVIAASPGSRQPSTKSEASTAPAQLVAAERGRAHIDRHARVDRSDLFARHLGAGRTDIRELEELSQVGIRGGDRGVVDAAHVADVRSGERGRGDGPDRSQPHHGHPGLGQPLADEPGLAAHLVQVTQLGSDPCRFVVGNRVAARVDDDPLLGEERDRSGEIVGGEYLGRLLEDRLERTAAVEKRDDVLQELVQAATPNRRFALSPT